MLFRSLAAHLHNARSRWIRTLGTEFGIVAPALVDHHSVTRRALQAALRRSGRGLEELLRLGLESGGELPAATVINGVVRLLPGTVGTAASLEEESHSGLLLEHPHYTRPASFRGMEVPAVLRSGDHGAIARWRFEQQQERTRQRRPDLHALWLDQQDWADAAGGGPEPGRPGPGAPEPRLED